ncbi:hypothetical protein BDV12DRAFT_160474 [Aspergillus spectabilis]
MGHEKGRQALQPQRSENIRHKRLLLFFDSCFSFSLPSVLSLKLLHDFHFTSEYRF